MTAAAGLRACGLEEGDRVALIFDSCWQYAVYFLAVLRAGGVVVPLNPLARAPDLVSWVHHAGASLVLAEKSHIALAALRQALPAAGRLLACAGASDPLAAGAARHAGASFPDPTAASPALILFTSGTSGAPKGVLLSHGNLCANAQGIVESLSLSAADSVMAVLPFSYAYGNSVLLSHLSCGARVVIQRGFTFPHAVVEAMVRERVTGFA